MQIIRYESTDSTQQRAREYLGKKTLTNGEPIVFTAAQQTTGRGRLERQWISPPGGLYLTYVHQLRSAVNAGPLSLRTGLITCRALEKVSGLNAGVLQIKWPNDLYVHGRKLGGILCEVIHAGGAQYVLIGVGININIQPCEQAGDSTGSTGVPARAISLREVTGRSFDVDQVAQELIYALQAGLPEEAGGVLSSEETGAIEARLRGKGGEITLLLPGGETIRGRLAGINGEGTLRIILKTGEFTVPGGAQVVEIQDTST